MPPKDQTNPKSLALADQLINAISEKNIEKVRMLLWDSNLDPNQPDSDGFCPLHFACFWGFEEIVIMLIKAQANILRPDVFGHTPVEYARCLQHTMIIQKLESIEKKLALQMFDAVKKNQECKVQVLLDLGLNPNYKNKKGTTPLHLATAHGFDNLTELLLAHKANPNSLTDKDITPLYLSVMYNRPEIFKQLIDHGANIHHLYHGKKTILHVACRLGLVEMVEILVENGAELTCQDANGKTPKDYARLSGNKQLERYLNLGNTKSSHLQPDYSQISYSQTDYSLTGQQSNHLQAGHLQPGHSNPGNDNTLNSPPSNSLHMKL